MGRSLARGGCAEVRGFKTSGWWVWVLGGGLQETSSGLIKEHLESCCCSPGYVGGTAHNGRTLKGSLKSKADSSQLAFPLRPLGKAVRTFHTCVWCWGDHRHGSQGKGELSSQYLLDSAHGAGLGFQAIAWEQWSRAMPRKSMGILINLDGQFDWTETSRLVKYPSRCIWEHLQ